MEDVRSIYNTAVKTNAGEVHFEVGQPFGDPEAILVVSVYRGERPVNKILKDLEAWLEATGNEDVLDKIQELADPKIDVQ